MAHRQDIDALLIGALYGELTPAEETQLEAHLTSHPSDRNALEGLTHARELVVQSRLFETQVEPPQAVSALLLQEAARRAPKAPRQVEEREGWFTRFVRTFAANPAIAAAAMLVVVLGAATFMTSRKGDSHVAGETSTVTSISAAAESDNARNAGDFEESASGAQFALDGRADGNAAPAAAATPIAGTDQYQVTLADEETSGDALKGARGGEEASKKEFAYRPPAKPTKATGSVELRSQEHTPKDLDQALAFESTVAPGGGPRSTTSAQMPPPPPASQPAPPARIATDRRVPDATVSRDDGVAPSPEPRAKRGLESEDKAAVDPQLAWAQRQHSQVIAQVRAGNCQNAAGLAVDLSNRAPGYYTQNVVTDRAIKNCVAYINTERERDAERRASKTRTNRSEPAPKAAPAKPKAADAK